MVVFQIPFSTAPVAIVKALVMMTGEVEYSNMFFADDPAEKLHKGWLANIIVVAFILLVTILIMNLLVHLVLFHDQWRGEGGDHSNQIGQKRARVFQEIFNFS